MLSTHYTDLILHIDCNSFYVSCQASFDPTLRGKAVVVLSSNDGNVIARSAAAKNLGVKMGQPYFQVKHWVRKGKLRPFSSNYELYGDMSSRVMNILRRFTDQVEVYSIDEAFLGMEGHGPVDYVRLARQIKDTIYRCTRIPVSIGMGPTRTLAKLANKVAKKNPDLDGICKLDNQEQIDSILQEIPVGDLWGIGKQYTEMLNSFGILTAYQLINCPDEWLRIHLTVVGLRMIHELRGEKRYKLADLPKANKSVMVAPSFGRAITDITLMEEALVTHIARATEKIRRQNLAANLITVFVGTNRFRINEPQHHASRTVSLPYSSHSITEISSYALEVLKYLYREGHGYRKVGILLSGLIPDGTWQNQLFITEPNVRLRRVTQLVDWINLKHGKDTIRFANQGFRTEWHSKHEWKSRCYTTRVKDMVEAC